MHAFHAVWRCRSLENSSDGTLKRHPIVLPAAANQIHSSANCTGGPLLPELALLPALQVFKLYTFAFLPCGLPAAWGAPGAFPKLEW